MAQLSRRSATGKECDISEENCTRIRAMLDEADEVLPICAMAGMDCDDLHKKVTALRTLFEKMLVIIKREKGK